MATGDISIAVLISGSGTTLKNLIEFRARNQLNAKIKTVISSNPDAKGLDHARAAQIQATVVEKKNTRDSKSFSDDVFNHCRDHAVDLVVMGGFLKHVLIPDDFENRVINIHPSLIPAFSGKGMYGSKVHQAVLDYGCKLSGCTVHFVDNQFDHGPIIAQRSVPVCDGDHANTLAARVFEQECELYPAVINQIAAGNVSIEGRKVSISV